MTGASDRAFWVALAGIPGLGSIAFRRLVRAFGEPRSIFSAGHGALCQVVPAPLARAIAAGPSAEVIEATDLWLADPANQILTWADEGYPRLLLEISDPPPLLYLKGRQELLNRPALAIVGSRNPTPQGLANAVAFAHHLSDAGFTIISGLALGVDGAAHHGGLLGASSSVGVVGTGLDIVYPARHKDLAHQLAAQGCIISEFALGTPSKAQNFPRRNRIISGLAQGTLVVEAALQSGSLITARLAAEQGREVFAVPGSIHSPLSKGCHRLIKQGAKLVETAQDILDELRSSCATQDTRSTAPVDDAEKLLLDCLGYDPTGIDGLTACSGLTSERVSAILLNMELAGMVASLPGGFYQRIS